MLKGYRMFIAHRLQVISQDRGDCLQLIFAAKGPNTQDLWGQMRLITFWFLTRKVANK
jgi:hypothetical protein